MNSADPRSLSDSGCAACADCSRPRLPPYSPAHMRGMSLVEVMVAMVIGLVLIFGATQVYVDSRAAYSTNETVARLQENARYALSIIEPDIRMSNYWGYLKGASYITVPPTLAAPTLCGNTFATNLAGTIEGDNDGYTLNCTASLSGAVTTADTLTVRRAAQTNTATAPLHICSTRESGQLVSDTSGCQAAPTGAINDLIVDAYYICKDSDQQTGLPSLRRKALAAGNTFSDTEIVAGVEDMQVQLGIDPTGSSGVATQYVDIASSATLNGAQVVSVRIWLLLRAENPEPGFTDGRTYTYADRTYTPKDGYRRLLVSRTIMIRNAIGT